MFANLSDIIKIPSALLIGMLISALVLIIVYEGVSLPLVGQVINGVVANRVDAATEKMVTKAQAEALSAQITLEHSRRLAAEQLATDAGKRADAALQLKTNAEAALNARIATDTGSDGAVWTQEDIQWGRH